MLMHLLTNGAWPCLAFSHPRSEGSPHREQVFSNTCADERVVCVYWWRHPVDDVLHPSCRRPSSLPLPWNHSLHDILLQAWTLFPHNMSKNIGVSISTSILVNDNDCVGNGARQRHDYYYSMQTTNRKLLIDGPVITFRDLHCHFCNRFQLERRSSHGTC